MNTPKSERKGRLTETHNRFLSQQTPTHNLVVSVKLALLQKTITKFYYHIKLGRLFDVLVKINTFMLGLRELVSGFSEVLLT